MIDVALQGARREATTNQKAGNHVCGPWEFGNHGGAFRETSGIGKRQIIYLKKSNFELSSLVVAGLAK